MTGRTEVVLLSVVKIFFVQRLDPVEYGQGHAQKD